MELIQQTHFSWREWVVSPEPELAHLARSRESTGGSECKDLHCHKQ